MNPIKGAAAVLAAALLLPALSSAAEGTRHVELVSVSGYEPSFDITFAMPFEHLLRDTTGVSVEGIENVPAKFSGNSYSYKLDDAAPAAGGQTQALENAEGFFVLSPADPELLKAFLKTARAYPLLPPTFERAARAEAEGGSRTFAIDSPRKAAKQERATLASIYHLKIDGKPVDAVFLLKVTGGLGRLATALEALPPAPRVIVSRGTWGFRSEKTTLRGRALWEALEKLGVKISAVGRGELRHWDELTAYRKEHPDGIQFVAANLSQSGLNGKVVIEKNGIKIAFIGVTRMSYAKYLGRGGLEGVALSSPLVAVRDLVRQAREEADLVVVLSNLSQADNARLRDSVRGIDAIVADSQEQAAETQDPRPLSIEGKERGPFSPALLLAQEYDGVDRLDFTLGAEDAAGYRDLEVRQSQTILDDSFADAEGYPRFTAAEFEVHAGSGPVLVPDARKLFPGGNKYGGSAYPRIVSRDFWTLSASLMADRTGSELGVLPVTNIGVPTPGDFGEDEVRNWFGWDDTLVTFELPGSDLKALVDEADAEKRQEAADFAPAQDRLKLAVAGLGPGDTIHGLAIDPSLGYRVAGTRMLLANTDAYPGLSNAKNVETVGDLQDGVVGDLKKRAAKDWPPERYVSLMEGAPVHETPFWTINFRDIGLNFTQTDVVKNQEAFAPVNNPRIQGFNETDLGMDAKIDANYAYRSHRWSNTFEMEYSESRIRPPDAPDVLNVPNNRIQYLTTGTEKLASFPVSWLGQSVGPSLGLQYDGEVKQLSTEAKRRNIYSAFPGVEILDGTVVKTLQITGNLKKDYSTDPVQSQYGARIRMLAECPVPVGHGGQGSLQSEIWGNYFFRKPGDTDQDLLLEGDANLKLQIPIWKDLTLAPFIDVYWFKLKSQPLSGYSAQTGVSLSFSRLWKPQYEKFF